MAINNRSQLSTDPIRNFRFLVQFEPHATFNNVTWRPTLGFTSISGLAVQTESIPYREGGYNTTIHQIPGQTTFSPITMQRGVMLGTQQNLQWMRRLFSVGERDTAATNPGFRSDITIWVLNHPQVNSAGSEIGANISSGYGTGLPGDQLLDDAQKKNETPVMRFKVYNAWPTAVAYSDLNAGDNALVVEQCTFVHEGFDVSLKSIDSSTGLPANFDDGQVW